VLSSGVLGAPACRVSVSRLDDGTGPVSARRCGHRPTDGIDLFAVFFATLWLMTTAVSQAFLELSRGLRDRIERALRAYLAQAVGVPEVLGAAIRHSLLAPGKRLRPMLVLMAAEACGGEEGSAMPAACAVEMVHTYSLIHDDLPAMDDDDMRRGVPSCHAAFGEAMAILAGDALQALAFEVLARDTQPPATAVRCCAELAHAAGLSGMVGGQVDDLTAGFVTGDLNLLESIHRRKTGAMFNASLRLGGLVAGAADEQLAALEAYGGRLGLAFQIMDDVLDSEGDEAAMGKHAGKDSAHGKLTFPSVLGGEESRRRAGRLVDLACAALAPWGVKAGSLEMLARFVTERTR